MKVPDVLLALNRVAASIVSPLKFTFLLPSIASGNEINARNTIIKTDLMDEQ